MVSAVAPHLIADAQAVSDAGVALFEFRAAPTLPFGVSRFEVSAGAETSLDEHPVDEIWLVAMGAGALFYDGQWHSIDQGDAVRFRGGVPHRMRNTGNSPMTIFSIWWLDRR